MVLLIYLKQNGLVIFGPSAAAAQLEGSKVYMKNILKKITYQQQHL